MLFPHLQRILEIWPHQHRMGVSLARCVFLAIARSGVLSQCAVEPMAFEYPMCCTISGRGAQMERSDGTNSTIH